MIRIDSSWSGLPQAPNIMAPRHSWLTETPVRPSRFWRMGLLLFLDGSRRKAPRGGGSDAEWVQGVRLAGGEQDDPVGVDDPVGQGGWVSVERRGGGGVDAAPVVQEQRRVRVGVRHGDGPVEAEVPLAVREVEQQRRQRPGRPVPAAVVGGNGTGYRYRRSGLEGALVHGVIPSGRRTG